MKVMLINGSPRPHGCTFNALSEVAKSLNNEGIETEIFQTGTGAIRDCIACMKCKELNNNRCIFNDDMVNELIEKAKDFDGFVFGSPVYYSHPSGRTLSLLDRMFYAGGKSFAYKPGAAIVSARRAGTTASFDVLNKYFTINNMPIVSSRYWNMVHGIKPEDAFEDAEGMQVMRILGKNMAWLLKCIELGKQNGLSHPEPETPNMTNFIR